MPRDPIEHVIDVVAFDGDDTLWPNESIFSMTHERFAALMAPYVEPDSINERLFATEMRNLALFDYGVRRISETHQVMLITKGDLFDQESKLARSGLGDHFDAVEIVATKDERAYSRILRRHGTDPSRFVMIGHSPRSDIVPVLGLGGWAIHVPHPLTWARERVDDEKAMAAHECFRLVTSLKAVPGAIARLAGT